ncbi:hypothetical protein GIB67_027035 [Kingdonia uniflora]|uniref:AAA+ ATPase domain-containing protein n=1 Tax=Kingdonia uniflora TaxID=39325 RepID=A0A7J7P1Y4_9MAGN|nr:hypothetical protein GIB67_027035 [Kingdonia uniflora]
MTRPIHGRFLSDENADIVDHLRNHVHLTNCIHLKNHMHRHSPVMAERSIMRDLIAIQRSRSLRDPSTSPRRSWHSPSNTTGGDGRRKSVEIDRRKGGRRLSVTSPRLVNVATSKVAAAEVSRGTGSSIDVVGTKGEQSSRRSHRSDHSVGTEEALKNLQKGKDTQNAQLKSLSEKLKEFTGDSDVHSSHILHHGRPTQSEKKLSGEPETSIHGYHNGLNRVKRRKVRGARKARASLGTRDLGLRHELSVASSSLAQGSTHHKYPLEAGEGRDGEMDVVMAPANGCGIPWNWSRLHHRSKTFFDKAGRSLSCGLSEPKLRKGASDSQGTPVISDSSSSSTKSDVEATPLLIEPSGSHESIDKTPWTHGYSGELGIFADHYLGHDVDSDLSSEPHSFDQRKVRGYRHASHQSLTQKYTPHSFRELVGQNLVAQALSNAVVRRKIGLLYVFHGPHGTGKTSCARIFARALNCQSTEHHKPCGVCNSCIAHDMGKSRHVREVGPVGNFDFESIMDLLDHMTLSHRQSQYNLFIFDDCQTLPQESWSAISKVIDRAPRRVVFVLICTNLDNLPHTIISRCQKFFFPKLKDADIIYTLQWIATKEDLEIDKDALKLIASRSDGSLRDAEMTLEQLSLLGQRISLQLVQELVGLISDEKLVDLLDLALSADTVNTVKNLREIMEAGVEPLALMSQLATVITDILAGSYIFTKERLRQKFFRRLKLSKEDMEKLRQALKTLSEAEKQLRTSNDRLTWLTAALLQLAPDQQYMLPSSSTETSFNHTPLVQNNTTERGLSTRIRMENVHNRNADHFMNGSQKVSGDTAAGKKHAGISHLRATDLTRKSGGRNEIEEVWFKVLEKIQNSSLKQFMQQEGKLVSVSYGAGPTAHLVFGSHGTKSKAEKFRGHILRAFEFIIGSPVTLEMTYESRKDAKERNQLPLILPASEDGSLWLTKSGYSNDVQRGSKDKALKGIGSRHARFLGPDSAEMAEGEITEVVESARELQGIKGKGLESAWTEEASSSHQILSLSRPWERRTVGEQAPSQSLVRSKVSLAHVIQAEGGTQGSGWSRRKAISIAEKLEQENLRLEPRSRSLLCWNTSKLTRGKLSRLRIRARKPRSLLKLVTCGRCLSSRSPR